MSLGTPFGWFVAVVVATAATGCAEADRAIEPAPVPRVAVVVPRPVPEGRAIATLITHDARIAIVRGTEGDLAVRVTRDSGTRVVAFADLAREEPDLYTVVTSAVASREPGAPYLDARLDRPVTRR